jgi:hypothetical protein
MIGPAPKYRAKTTSRARPDILDSSVIDPTTEVDLTMVGD